MSNKTNTLTLGGGCFWCLTPCYEMLKGVTKVTSGYAGGNTGNPTYEEVSTGNTGHAEVIQIEFNPEEISTEKILEVFLFLHDPTQLNRQGNDIGTQYRSIILYQNEKQKAIAEKSLKKHKEAKTWKEKIVTEIVPLTHFYSAEDYHQGYYNKNPKQPYCNLTISPKIEKFKEKFRNWIK